MGGGGRMGERGGQEGKREVNAVSQSVVILWWIRNRYVCMYVCMQRYIEEEERRQKYGVHICCVGVENENERKVRTGERNGELKGGMGMGMRNEVFFLYIYRKKRKRE